MANMSEALWADAIFNLDVEWYTTLLDDDVRDDDFYCVSRKGRNGLLYKENVKSCKASTSATASTFSASSSTTEVLQHSQQPETTIVDTNQSKSVIQPSKSIAKALKSIRRTSTSKKSSTKVGNLASTSNDGASLSSLGSNYAEKSANTSQDDLQPYQNAVLTTSVDYLAVGSSTQKSLIESHKTTTTTTVPKGSRRYSLSTPSPPSVEFTTSQSMVRARRASQQLKETSPFGTEDQSCSLNTAYMNDANQTNTIFTTTSITEDKSTTLAPLTVIRAHSAEEIHTFSSVHNTQPPLRTTTSSSSHISSSSRDSLLALNANIRSLDNMLRGIEAMVIAEGQCDSSQQRKSMPL